MSISWIVSPVKQIFATRDCPVDCLMGHWGQWSKCSLDCVNVSMNNQTNVFPKRIRTRKILRKSNARGQSCDQFESRDIKTCNMRPCPIGSVDLLSHFTKVKCDSWT